MEYKVGTVFTCGHEIFIVIEDRVSKYILISIWTGNTTLIVELYKSYVTNTMRGREVIAL